MKRLTAAVSIIVMGALLGCSQMKPTRLTDLDKERLKRTEAQLQSLQMRYQAEANIIIQEHEDIVKKYCTAAGLVYGQGGNCSVDSATGLISKQGALPTNPSAPSPKK